MDPKQLYANSISQQRNSGYWQVNGRCFFEKIKCLQYASKIKNYNITYHLFDNEFGSLDWASDQIFNLDELYKRRAQQIRDKYKYVMVAFSGGADSRNLLNTFLENNIPIEEIVSYYPIQASAKLMNKFDATDKSANNAIFEYYLACQPTLQEISKKYPNIKITIIDYTEYSIDIINSDQPEKLIKYGTTLGIYNAGERMLSNMLKNYSEKYNSACCVYGIDKPNIVYDIVNKRLGFNQSDFAHNKCKFEIDGYYPNIEPFYSTPNMPEIMLAQAKAINRTLLPMLTAEVIPPALQEIIRITPNPNILKLDEHTDIIKSILYKNYNPLIYQTDKPIMTFAGQESDHWFVKSGLVDSKAVDYFQGQHKDWLHGVDDALIVRDDKGMPLRFKSYLSKVHWC
jgi:hypothetical protein